MYHFPWKLGLIVAVCAVILSSIRWLLIDDAGNPSTDVVIGILSARSNFDYRQAIRQTWLNTTNSNSSSMRGWFIVGRKACMIPPEDRVDVKSCVRWNPKYTDDSNGDTYSSLITGERFRLHRPVNQGFTFEVLHPIIVNRLGYLNTLVPTSKQNYTLALKNAISQDTVVKVQVTSEKTGVLIDGYRYLPVESHILPKGFEASVVIETSDGVEIHTHFKQLWRDAGGLISYNLDLRDVKRNLAFRHNDSEVSAVSVGFSIYAKHQLKTHIAHQAAREKDWLAQLEKEDRELRTELGKYEDIILVDLVDVYQHLPLKLLSFIEWVTNNYKFKYLLKTDDDCVINIKKIYHELKDDKSLSEDNIWWSKFRYNWLVDRVSKWAEADYLAPVYPPFGCGLGNVLSADLVHWLAGSAKKLHAYQGEDVSLGIWLAAVLPRYLDDPRWQCEAGCDKKSFNIGQLTPDEITSSWKSLQVCNNFCGC